jgi:hypothetical protein
MSNILDKKFQRKKVTSNERSFKNNSNNSNIKYIKKIKH